MEKTGWSQPGYDETGWAGVERAVQDGQSVQLEVGSGRYSFTYTWP